ncbi:DUF1697 domain-containing protein [Arthrobacter sp. PAMC25284]|uniref:DUF1697 domain-containing protein n=1 Tax=Arthrobacter sp. PAMC25284 TaxID=2861279 RepID=UPI001C63312E|nr:DUF1697 domain-containing protein [Arthrobacter sp. PAMC25284]QYF89863.1 DUF1697 domain-containing protein [Arthrobacter sp. PAMC25284]
MTSYAVFLRGINVGGVTIKMADLRNALAPRPFTGVKTLLASGNVVLTSSLDQAGVKDEFESCLRAAFGYDAWVVVLTAARVAELAAACPYPADDASTHTYMTLTSAPETLDELQAAATAAGGTDLTRLGPEALAWLAPAGGTLDSPFGRISAKPKYKAFTTTRNLRTLVKVRDAAAALEGLQ